MVKTGPRSPLLNYDVNFVLIFYTSFISYHGDQSSGQCAYRLIRRQLVRCDASSGQSTVCCCWWIVSLLITTDLLITRPSEINASPITFPVFTRATLLLARVIEIATCLSVCLSRAGIVSKRRKLAA